MPAKLVACAIALCLLGIAVSAEPAHHSRYVQ